MNPDNLAILDSELRRDEGVRYEPYRDTKGILTTGVGHNLEASPLPEGWTYPLSDDQVNQLLNTDLTETFNELDIHLPWWKNMDDVRQRVIANMCFNLGINRLLGFFHTLAYMRQGRYDEAADGMENSAWYGEVGERAVRLCYMMRNGVVMP